MKHTCLGAHRVPSTHQILLVNGAATLMRVSVIYRDLGVPTVAVTDQLPVVYCPWCGEKVGK